MKRKLLLSTLINFIILSSFTLMFGFSRGEIDDIERYKNYKEYTDLLDRKDVQKVEGTVKSEEIEEVVVFDGEEFVDEEVKKEEKTVKRLYIVKKGDSLYKISKEMGIDINVLIVNNPHVKDGKLRIGDKLDILEGNSVAYTVEKGDNLIKIAKKFNVDVNRIIERNKLETTVVQVNQELIIENPDMNFVIKEVERQKGFKVRNPLKKLYVTSPFGKRFHPVYKKYKLHKGVDLRARYVDLYAAASGRVTVAGWVNGYGKLIIIKHSDGYETRYAHLNKIKVKVGDRIKEGEKIGQTGSTGVGNAPHLHFEVRKNGKALNPLQFIK